MTPKRHYAMGALWIGIGLVGSIVFSSLYDGMHAGFSILWWGPMAYGLIRLIRGLNLAHQLRQRGVEQSGPITYNQPTPRGVPGANPYASLPEEAYHRQPYLGADVSVSRRNTPVLVYVLSGAGLLTVALFIVAFISINNFNTNSRLGQPGWSQTVNDPCACQVQPGQTAALATPQASAIATPAPSVPGDTVTVGPTAQPATLKQLTTAGYKDLARGIAVKRLTKPTCGKFPVGPNCFAWDAVNYKATCARGEFFILLLTNADGSQREVSAGANYANSLSAPERIAWSDNDGSKQAKIVAVTCNTL